MQTIEQGLFDGKRTTRSRVAGRARTVETATARTSRAVERVGAVDRFQFDELAFLLAAAFQRVGHGPHGDRFGDASARLEECEFVCVGCAMNEMDGDIAAEQHAAFLCKPGQERRGQRAHTCDRGDAQHETGKEYPEAGKAAAHLAPREPPVRGRDPFTRPPLGAHYHTA